MRQMILVPKDMTGWMDMTKLPNSTRCVLGYSIEEEAFFVVVCAEVYPTPGRRWYISKTRYCEDELRQVEIDYWTDLPELDFI